MNLLEHVVQLSNSTNVPLAMHLAETEEELQLLDGQDGPLAELLQQLEIWPPPHIVRHTRPLDYLRSLARASRALVIHGNFLADDELAFLAKHRERMTLVFCPRTHAYFAHRQCPLLRANELGVRIALGTDSCASNPDLSVWREAIYVAEHYPEFPKSVLLQSFTQFGREAFYGPQEGFIIGSAASFCVIRLDENTNGLPSAETDDPWHALFTAGSRPQDAWWHGERITLESRM